MNDEIKEILNDLLFTTTLPNGVSFKLDKEKINQLKDYITNLEQENERLKQTQYIWSYDLDMQLENYKSRCEKAIEYMKENNFHYMNEYALERFRNDLLNILQNGSDSQ